MRPRDSPNRGDGRGLLDAEHLGVWFVTVFLVTSVAGTTVLYGEEIRDTTPDGEFAVGYDEDSRTVTVAYTRGVPVRDRVTDRLSVVVVDVSNGTSTRVDWARDDPWYSDRGSGYPVVPGDTITIDDPTVDDDGDGDYHDANATVGFHLVATDRVRVVWTGARRGGKTTTKTLLNTTVGPSDGTTRYEAGGD